MLRNIVKELCIQPTGSVDPRHHCRKRRPNGQHVICIGRNELPTITARGAEPKRGRSHLVAAPVLIEMGWFRMREKPTATEKV
ncbi:hypothetical protein KQX54_008235 [Cotesia glomerata]|uniref:Uncharacterized protein n=1 Tax=Cotesia glomerata TaxID=32391 RepID=A0AAV7I1X7_COTGL|nr:hypothetical protein KQX54_008235 [Cotesia glomerata]